MDLLKDSVPLEEGSTGKMYALFSPKAAAMGGYCVYLREDGTKVRITCVASSREAALSDYYWDDIEEVGYVTLFVEARKRP